MIDISQMVERQPVAGASVQDVNLNLVREHITRAIRRRSYEGPTEPEEYLRAHGCITRAADGSAVPTLAGIMAFSNAPEQFVTSSGIDIAQFRTPQVSTASMVVSRQVRGPLLTVIDRTIELLWALTEHRVRLEGTERVEEDAFSMVVLRELTVNAIAHRDWGYDGTHVRVQIFPDRIEWISPGGFPGRAPGGVTLETLLNAQISRNPTLAQILYHAGQIESFGMGIDTVMQVLQEAGIRPPEVFDNQDIFKITVWGRRFANDSMPFGANLTTRQMRILTEIKTRGKCTSVVLAGIFDTNTRTIQRELKELREMGFVIAEGETSNRSYRLVESE